MKFSALQFGLLCFIINLMCSSVEGSNIEQGGIFARAIRIENQDFEVTETVTRSMSLIVCGARFSIAREAEKFSGGANGFYFNEENRECQIGKVSFPVHEVESGGIKVYGISKYFFLSKAS